MGCHQVDDGLLQRKGRDTPRQPCHHLYLLVLWCLDLKDWSAIFSACVKLSWHRGLELRFLIFLWHLAMYNLTSANLHEEVHNTDVLERDEWRCHLAQKVEEGEGPCKGQPSYMWQDLMIFYLSDLSFLEINSKWCKIKKYVRHYCFNKMYNVACFLMKMINHKSFSLLWSIRHV